MNTPGQPNRALDMTDTVDENRVAIYHNGALKYSLLYSNKKWLSYKLEVDLVEGEAGANLGSVFFADHLLSKNDVPFKIGSACMGTVEATLTRDGHFTNRHSFLLPPTAPNVPPAKFTWGKPKSLKALKNILHLTGENGDICALFTPVQTSSRAGRLELLPSVGHDLEIAAILSCVGMLAKQARDKGEKKIIDGIFDSL